MWSRKNRLDYCINRNILECKGNLSRITAISQPGINRNILECKGATGSWYSCGSGVLIETYWNVKEDDRDIHYAMMNVLIETYWNVKGDTFDVETSFVTY